MRASNWFQQADQAMIRAAARARAVAASTGTSIHIMKDGKIVEILPEKEWGHCPRIIARGFHKLPHSPEK